MKAGLDIGYHSTKVMAGNVPHQFLSIVGTPDEASFSMTGQEGLTIAVPGDKKWLVGREATRQSRFAPRREDRAWIESDEYYALAMAALTSVSDAKNTVIHGLVTGLPVDYHTDKSILVERLKGEHLAIRNDGEMQRFMVEKVAVLPQPIGTVLSVACDTQGNVIDQEIAEGHVGVLDIGGKTVNYTSVDELTSIGHETKSISKGTWEAMKAIRVYLAKHCSGLENLRDHKIMDAILARKVKYAGRDVDLGGVIDTILEPMAEEIIAGATSVWNGGEHLHQIIVTGGGSYLFGKYVCDHFYHAKVAQNPTFANVIGYWKFSHLL